MATLVDSSHANAMGSAAQLVHLVSASDICSRTVLPHKSHQDPRSAPSSLLSEADGMSEALADRECVASWIGLCNDLTRNMRQKHKLNRANQFAALSTCHDDSELDLAIITDAKSLFDALTQKQHPGAGMRAALEAEPAGCRTIGIRRTATPSSREMWTPC